MRVLFLLFFSLNILFAHKINLFITTNEKQINIYSYFASGKPCSDCKLIVKNSSNIVLEDRLNKEGKYSFEAKNKNLEIIVDASSGHIAKKELDLKDVDFKSIEKQISEEKTDEIYKIILSLVLIFLIFFLFKRFLKR